MKNASNNPTTPTPEDRGDVFGPIGDYLGFVIRSVGRHRLLAICVFLAVASLGVAATRVLPFRYRVDATILAQRNVLMGALSNPGMNRDWDAPTRAARSILIRRQNLVALCEHTNFVKRHLAKRAPAVLARDWVVKTLLGREKTEAEVAEDIVDALQTSLGVNVSSEGGVTITFVWSDPDLAYDVVEAAVQSFLEARNSSELGGMGEAIAILQGHATRVQKEIAAAIDALNAKGRALGLTSTPVPLVAPRLRQRTDENLARLRGMLAARRRALADVEEFRQRRVAELQVQLTQQLATYAPEHPAVVSTRANIESLTAASPQVLELRASISEIEREIKQRGGDEPEDMSGMASVEAEIQTARMRVSGTQDARLEYERSRLETLLRRHAFLSERIDAARIELDTAQADFSQRYSVITPPQRPRGPVKPYSLRFLLGGLFGGATLAFIVSALTDVLSGRVVERWQIEHGLGIPVLGETRPRSSPSP